MFTETFTLFNYHKQTGMWHLTVFTGTVLDVTVAKSAGTNGMSNGDDIFILLRCGADKSVNGKAYLMPGAYSCCETPEEYFTFSPERDFVYHGSWESLEPMEDDEYEAGLYHAMNEACDGVYMIRNARFYGLLPHFELGAG